MNQGGGGYSGGGSGYPPPPVPTGQPYPAAHPQPGQAPAQGGYPAQAGHPAQAGYPAQAGHPAQAGGGYPAQGGYPAPAGHGAGWGHAPPAPHGYPAAHAAPSGIVFTCSQGMQWLAPSPMAEINGHRVQLPWGTFPVTLPPGNHDVFIYYEWILQKASQARMVIAVQPGCMTHVHYETSFFTFSSGSLVITGMQPVG